jgi:hypothetical protein
LEHSSQVVAPPDLFLIDGDEYGSVKIAELYWIVTEHFDSVGDTTMAGFDGNGPMGNGPMTGRGRGLCNPAAASNEWIPGAGRRGGYGSGRGSRRGYCRFFSQNIGMKPVDELAALRRQADFMKDSLEAIQNKIAELEKTDTQ